MHTSDEWIFNADRTKKRCNVVLHASTVEGMTAEEHQDITSSQNINGVVIDRCIVWSFDWRKIIIYDFFFIDWSRTAIAEGYLTHLAHSIIRHLRPTQAFILAKERQKNINWKATPQCNKTKYLNWMHLFLEFLYGILQNAISNRAGTRLKLKFLPEILIRLQERFQGDCLVVLMDLLCSKSKKKREFSI